MIEVFPICTAAGGQHAPAISGNSVVWQDHRSWVSGIYGYDLTSRTEFPICTAGGQVSPAISGNVVVWEDCRTIVRQIHGYDLTSKTEFPICTAAGGQHAPAISGNVVVWEDYRNGDNADIYGYDLTSRTQFPVCTAASHQGQPAISGNVVVWTDLRNGYSSYSDIYGYDLTSRTEFPICTAASYQARPAISGNVVVWEDYRNPGDGDIHGYDLTSKTEFPICTAAGGQHAPAISGNVVVWEDYRNGDNADIYGYDLTSRTEFPICTAYGPMEPAISGNVVVWEDYRNPDGDICGVTLQGPSAATSVKPLVVLISGISSNTYPGNAGYADWRLVGSKLRSAGYDVMIAETQRRGGYPRIDSESPYWDTSARCLNAQLDVARYRGRPIILVGHSMGGLIARSYAELWRRDSRALTSGCKPLGILQLGTPNEGSRAGKLGYWPFTARPGDHSSLAMRKLGDEGFMAEFNASHANRQRLPIYRIGGTYFPNTAWSERSGWSTKDRGIYELIRAGFGGEINDSAVTVSSLLGGPALGWAGYCAFDAVHTESSLLDFGGRPGIVRPVWTANQPGGDRNDEVMRQILKYVRALDANAGSKEWDVRPNLPSARLALVASAVSGGASEETTAQLEGAPGSLTCLESVVSLASGAAEVPFAVEGSAALLAVRPDSGSVSLSVRDGAGASIPCPTTTEDGTISATLDDLAAGGSYILTVSPAEGSPTQVSIAVLDTGVSSLRVLAPSQCAAGEAFTLQAAVYESDLTSETATFTRSTTPLSATASLDGGADVTLKDDGVAPDETAADGLYAASLAAPASGSSSEVVIHAAGEDAGGVAFQRVAVANVTVVEPRAALSGSYAYRTETNAEGQVSALLIDVGVTATQDCELELSGDVTSAGQVVAQSAATASLAAGASQTVTLRFSAESLYSDLASDGSFSVSRLSLADHTDADPALLQQATDVLTGSLERGMLAYSECSAGLVGANPHASTSITIEGRAVCTASPVTGVEYALDGSEEWLAVPAPASGWGAAEVAWSLPLTLADGDHVVALRALSAEGPIAGAQTRVSFAVDTAAPQTTSDAPAGWVRDKAVSVTLAASDATSVVSKTEFRLVGQSAWTTYVEPILVTAQGSTSYEYRSVDEADNTEVTKRTTVRIDRTRPVTRALYNTTVCRGRRATFRLRINDVVSPKATVTVKIFKGTALKKTLKIGLRATNRNLSYTSYTCMLARGTYVWKVYATDLAGNPQRTPVGYKMLIVR